MAERPRPRARPHLSVSRAATAVGGGQIPKRRRQYRDRAPRERVGLPGAHLPCHLNTSTRPSLSPPVLLAPRATGCLFGPWAATMHTASLTLSAATAPNLFSSLSASDVKADELIAYLWHPDLLRPPESISEFAMIHEEGTTLPDPTNKRMRDAFVFCMAILCPTTGLSKECPDSLHHASEKITRSPRWQQGRHPTLVTHELVRGPQAKKRFISPMDHHRAKKRRRYSCEGL